MIDHDFFVDNQNINQIFFSYANSGQNYRNLLYCRRFLQKIYSFMFYTHL